MKPSSNNTSKRAPIEEYNQLVDELKDMHPNSGSEESGGAVSNNVVTLKSRAQKLLIWITRHQNDVDRHDLGSICKEGKPLVTKILNAGANTDTSDLEAALWGLEARQMACDEDFAEELRGFKSISPDIIRSLEPDLQKTIRFRIAKATANIYKATDTPDDILASIENTHDREKECLVDDIIEDTLDRSNILMGKIVNREGLRKYIRERLGYMDRQQLSLQVSILLNSIPYAYRSSSIDVELPYKIDEFIEAYNRCSKELTRLHCKEMSRFPLLSRESLHIDIRDLSTYKSSLEKVFEKYDRDIIEMISILRTRLINKTANYLNRSRPVHVDQDRWNYAIERLSNVYYYLQSMNNFVASRNLSSYDEEISRLIATIS